MSRVLNVTLSLAVPFVIATAASASQGPGSSPGTASEFTQIAMFVVVYGSAACVIAAGLVKALTQR